MATFVLVLLVGGCAALASLVAWRILARALASYRDRYGIRSASDVPELLHCVDDAGLRGLRISAAALAFFCGLLAGGPAGGVIFSLVGGFLPGLLVRWQRRRWRVRFESQLVPALRGIASGLQAGLSLLQALEGISRESDGPFGKESRFLLRELKLGQSFDEAFEALGSRVGSRELDLVVAAVVLSRQLGGNLGEVLEGIAGTLQERFRLEGRVASLTAQGRMQGRVVAALPLLLGAVLWWMRPDLVEPMLRHSFGHLLVAAVIVLELAGLAWIRRIVRVDV